MKQLISMLLLSLLLAGGCKKDSINYTGNGAVTATFLGHVTDENGNAITGATATAYGQTVTTDANGIFKIKNVTVPGNHAFVKVAKTGFFDGSRTFTPIDKSTHFLEITLLSKNLISSFSAAAGATVQVGSNAFVQFPANAIKNANGSSYSGLVKVFAKHLDPTDADVLKKMPGDLIGVGSNEKESLLKSFGMMNVELEDAAGNKLNIADGKEVALSMTVPSSLLGTASPTIPLWYFNTETGLWKEEGTATLTGNKYTGNVKHFSWWNCDQQMNGIQLRFKLVDQNNIPLSNTGTYLTNITTMDMRPGYSDSTGLTTGLVYSNTVMKLEWIDGMGTVHFIQNIGPFNADTDLGTIVVNNPVVTGTYSGTLKDCNGNVVSNGYLIYTTNNYRQFIICDNNGNFSMNIRGDISTPFTLTAVDYYNLQTGTEVQQTLTAGIHALGTLSACGVQLDEFMKLSIDGGSTQLLHDVEYYSYGVTDSSYFNGSNQPAGSSFVNFSTNEITAAGTYNVSSLSGSYNNAYFSTYDLSGLHLVITNYPTAVGQFYEGSLSGTFINPYNNNQVSAITAIFKIKRTS